MKEFNTYKALSSNIRQEIVQFIGEKERYLSEIAEHVHKTPQTIDFHLNILSENGLIKSEEKDGKRYYTLTNDNVLDMIGPRRNKGIGLGWQRHKAPHEIVIDESEKINKRLNTIENKLDKMLKILERKE